MKKKYLLRNGRFFTSSATEEMASAVLVEEGIFTKVGTLEECQNHAKKTGIWENMEVVDFGGRLVLPSLLDGHTHPMMVAGTNWHCIMPATKDREQLLQNIKETAAAIPKEEMPYFYGECYYAETFGEEGPHRQLLDKLIPDRPACIQEYTDHECWYNTMALEMLHVPAVEDDSFVENKAFFMRDEEGKATGWVQEKDADLDMAIYEALDWYPPDGISEKYVEPFLRFIREKGVCVLMDASTTREEILQLFYTMDQQNRMKIYYEGALPLHLTDDLDQVLATIVDWRRRYTSRHVHINTMKVFFDGTNEIGTCASLEPLENDSSGKSFGKPELTEEQLVDILLRANDNNVDVHIHVVGDQGFRSCCNSVEKAKKKAGDKWSIFVTLAHCELMTREDAQRATKLGIFFDTTPHDAGGYYGEMAIPYLGKDRWSSMYDYRELLSAGGIIGHSSDVFSYMEANRANPFFGMEVAATRIDRELPLNPEKYEDSVRPPKDAVLPVKQLVKGYTYNNAMRMRMLDRLGTIEEGKAACLLAMDEDIFTMKPEDIHRIDPVAVLFDGEFLWNEM